jgi:MFS transporter, DHA2 family, multidrug resistance protein
MAMSMTGISLNTQSAVVGYSEGFMMMGIICAFILPLVFLAKIKKGEGLPVEGVH